jgi:MoxR-like ATPase
MSQSLKNVIHQAEQIILGKPQQIRLAMTCLLSRGHLLIEDLPGTGKTTLAHVLASSLGLQFQRIQFTSDLLPANTALSSLTKASFKLLRCISFCYNSSLIKPRGALC